MTKRILIIKLGAMGDVLRTTSLLPQIYEKYGHPEISWMLLKESEQLLNNNRFVREVLAVETENACIEVLRGREDDFDLVLSLEESVPAVISAAALKCDLVGFDYINGMIRPTETARDYWAMGEYGPSPENDFLKKQNKKTFQELMVELLELDQSFVRPILILDEAVVKQTGELLLSKGISEKEKFVVINFGSGPRWRTKRISLNVIEKLIANLTERDIKAVLTGSENEKKMLADLKGRYAEIIIIDDVSVPVFAGIISKASVLLTSDSLALHIGLSQSVNTIALFGPTSSSEIDMFSSGEKMVAPMDCVCCYKKECSKEPFCMELFDSSLITEIVVKYLHKSD